MGLVNGSGADRQESTGATGGSGTLTAAGSFLLPTFLRKLADPSIKTVLLCGCGGGFDFVHGLALYPELLRLGKQVVIGSYSFGQPHNIHGASDVFNEAGVVVKRVTAASIPAPRYGPEVHVASFLDLRYPSSAPHFVYAYYARSFTVPLLTRLYQQFIAHHAIDAIVLVDGGSDSLMVGDEEGLGDPIEDAVSVATVASLRGLKARVLLSIGLGTDRFNQVSDAASLRAIAELTRMGGFLGAVSLEPEGEGSRLYRDCLEHIFQRQAFRSVLAGTIASAIEGCFGSTEVPAVLQQRVKRGELFLWPLMAMLWGFDIEIVARRSQIAQWIRDCKTVSDCHTVLQVRRRALGENLRKVENLPRHEEMRG